MPTPQKTHVERVLRDALIEAARKYADDSAGGAPNGALESGSLLRIAAKRWRAAELEGRVVEAFAAPAKAAS